MGEDCTHTYVIRKERCNQGFTESIAAEMELYRLLSYLLQKKSWVNSVQMLNTIEMSKYDNSCLESL